MDDAMFYAPPMEILSASTIALIHSLDPSLITVPQNGTCLIALGLLNPSTRTPLRMHPLPTHLESAATFEFFGFTSERALQLYARKRAKEEETRTLFDEDKWAIEWVEWKCGHAQDKHDDWRGIMRDAGVKREVVDALMRKEHDGIRYTKSAAQWIREVIETSLDVLFFAEERARELLQGGEQGLRFLKRGTGGWEDDTGNSSGSDEDEDQGCQYQEEMQDIPVTLPPNHIALFKSVENRKIVPCIAPSAERDAPDFHCLYSFGPHDFSRTHGVCFYPHRWVAEQHSALLSATCPVAQRKILEIHVPLSHLDTVKTWNLAFTPNSHDTRTAEQNEEYRKFVYYSRTQTMYPKELSEKRKAHGVIHGPVAQNADFAFDKMGDWTQVSSHHLLSREKNEWEIGVKREVAKQYVWVRGEAVEALQEVCVGKCFLR